MVAPLCLSLSIAFAASSASARQRGELAKTAKSVPAPKAATETIKLKRSEVEDHLEDLPGLLQDASMEERNPGYEFTQIEPKSVYEKTGFKVGDILLEINGHAVESSADAMSLFMLLRNEKNFAVKLKRADKVVTRKYQIQDY